MYAPQRIWLGLVVVSSAIACSEGGQSINHDGVGATPPVAIASVAPTPEAARAKTTIAALRSFQSLETRVGSGQVLEPTGQGFRLPRSPQALRGELPKDTGEPLRIALDEDTAFSIEVADPDLKPATGQVVEGAVVYNDTLTATDLVQVADGGVFEELRLLRDPSAPQTIHYRITRGDHAQSLRITDGRIEILDTSGKVRIVGEPPFAIDARGVRRPIDIRIAAEHGQTTELVAKLSTDGLAFPIAIDPIWKNAGALTTARENHAAAGLASGSVVVSGGDTDGVNPLQSAEIWTLAGGWASAGTMQEARFGHTLTPISNGKLLAVGGFGTSSTLATSSEVYTPGGGTGTWGTQVAAGFTPRANHAAAMLSTGFVVVTGGSSANTSAQVYNSNNNTWASAGTLNTGRSLHASVVLAGDNVLVMGGRPAAIPLASVEVWNGAAWAPKHDMNTARAEMAAVLLPNGMVFVAGGRGGTGAADAGTGSALATAEVYDPAMDKWTNVTNTMSSPRIRPQAVVIQPKVGSDTARVLVVGGGTGLAAPNQISGTADLYDPATNQFYATESMVNPRTSFTLTSILPGGTSALATGGSTVVASASVRTNTSEVFDPLARRAGDTCTVATDCLSGVCTDSHCCDTSCTGQCSACDVAGSEGTCSPVTLNVPHGARAACANNFACVAGACAATCSADNQCAPGYYCGGNQCHLKGQPSASFGCTGNNQCANGLCVDSYCCDTSCTGECGACDVAAHLGTCFAVSGAPHAARAVCAGTGVGSVCGPVCNGVDLAACHYPTATKSCSADTCTTVGAVSTETHASQCNSAGACSDIAKDCGGYNCNGLTACNTTCGNDNDNTNCAPGYFCKAHVCTVVVGTGASCTVTANCGASLTCVDMTCCGQASCATGYTCGGSAHLGSCAKANGTACAGNNECGNGHCVDGVCCDTACNTGGACEACDVQGKVGTCSPVAGAPHTGGTSTRACTQAFLGTGACTAVCDGADRADCHYPDNSKPCGANACATDQGVGTETHTSVCDQAGHCQDVPRSCGNYACGATTCKTGCSPAGTDCASGFFCAAATEADGGTGDASVTDVSVGGDGSAGLACVPVLGLGNKCTTGLDCQGGLLCTDGVCCGVDNCGAGKACNIMGKEGRCAQPVGTACTDPSDCGPGGFCVDGFCCDSACTGECEACNVSTSKGICSPVAGDPVGQRTACPGAVGADPCSAQTCDGAQDRTKCVGHVGSKVSCRTAACAAGTATLAATCDGTGACPAAMTQPCTPFACDTNNTCKQSCATDSDCDSAYRCSNKLCIVGSTCKDSHTVLSGDNKATECSPYNCVAGKCGITCNSVTDCADGFACDDARQCVSLGSVGTSASSDQGGCSCRLTQTKQPTAALYWFSAALGLALARFKRVKRKSKSSLGGSVEGAAAAVDG